MCDIHTAASNAASIPTTQAQRDPSERSETITLTVSANVLNALFAAGNNGGPGSLALSVALNALEHSERSFEAIRALSAHVNDDDGGLTERRFEEFVWICEQQVSGAIGLVEAIEKAEVTQ